MGIFTRLANWKRYRACKKQQNKAFRMLKKFDPMEDVMLWRYWNNVYNYWGRESELYKSK